MNVAQPAIEKTSPPAAGRWCRADRLVDVGERALILALYAWLVVRLVVAFRAEGRVGNLLLLPSEGLVVVFFLLRRRATVVSRHPGEWLMAIGATCLPMAIAPTDGGALVPPVVGATVLLMGILAQVHAKVVLGRSIGCIPAHRGLKFGGPYRLVRHPMYAGYLLSHVAFLAMNPSPWNLAIYAAAYGLQVPRLLAEERLLGGDPRYREYMADVRYRLIPGVF